MQVEDERLGLLQAWIHDSLGWRDYTLAPASSDASFRRYFRVVHQGRSHIVMDAPPEKENIHPYVDIAAALLKLGLHVPEVLESDFRQGFLLLTDLGTRLYLAELDENSVDMLYGDAMRALLCLQCAPVTGTTLPPYGRTLLLNEMGLFRDWYVARHLGVALTDERRKALEEAFGFLAGEALAQPRVWVHRDYHSRNLMVAGRNNPGVLDFQDAVIGPVTYDLVSLLRDCYVAWPRERVEAWVRYYYRSLLAGGLIEAVGEGQFLRWFDLMGVQRHLKATGIFARLNIRDGKPGYLKDIPRTLGYVEEVSGRYSELEGLRRLLSDISSASPA